MLLGWEGNFLYANSPSIPDVLPGYLVVMSCPGRKERDDSYESVAQLREYIMTCVSETAAV